LHLGKCYPMSSRFALGTVQFGTSYGVANTLGQVSREDIDLILDHAWSAGIDTLDTAIEYGESELRLGEAGVGQWQIISKLPEIPKACTDVASWVQDSVMDSIGKLGVSRLRGLLLHRSQQLLGPQGEALYKALVAIREQGKVEKIGISIYSPDELDALWPHYSFDLVQAPFNILDRRLVASGWLARLHQAGVEVHIRSVFLQGLLLMDAANRPEKFNRWQPLWDEWHSWLIDHKTTPLQACLGFAQSQPEISRIVLGVDSFQHLKGIIATSHLNSIIFPANLKCEDIALINPAEWKKL
jgi:aryl-alcohol dehydrogenase-like predicted oxidoreductase